jgi:hypothetical protein
MTREAAKKEMEFPEAALVNAYGRWMGRGLGPREYLISSTGERIACDVFDAQANELVEAKSSSSRANVRMALGQLLDYRRHHCPDPGLILLVPDCPNEDLLALVQQFGVSVVYRNGDEQFVRIDSSSRS